MTNNKPQNSVQRFMRSNNYEDSEQLEYPEERCENCSFLFTFKGKTRCYAYEQENFRDDSEFHPAEDYTCDLFDDSDDYHNSIKAYQKALAKGVNPQMDPEYQEAIKQENDHYDSIHSIEINASIRHKVSNEWDDPNMYAHCSDWEDEPESCFHCADDDCPMNQD